MQEKLMEDMSIIDDFYNDFADQVETDFYEVEVRYRDREQSIQDIYHSELEYIALLQHGREVFEQKMRLQVQQQSKRGGLLSSSNKIICTDQEINILFALHQDILATHHRFLDELDERFRIWGPTQLISDVFREFVSIWPSIYKDISFGSHTLTCIYHHSYPNLPWLLKSDYNLSQRRS
jgi:RhoGEF domain